MRAEIAKGEISLVQCKGLQKSRTFIALGSWRANVFHVAVWLRVILFFKKIIR